MFRKAMPIEPPLQHQLSYVLDDDPCWITPGFIHVPFRMFPAVTINGEIHISASGVVVRPWADPEHLRVDQALAMALAVVEVAETLGMMRGERCHSDSGGQQRSTRTTRSRHRRELVLFGGSRGVDGVF